MPIISRHEIEQLLERLAQTSSARAQYAGATVQRLADRAAQSSRDPQQIALPMPAERARYVCDGLISRPRG